ncbi:uncharacterized protein LOC109882897 isoform X2 [Oncorhynchus kisutch]|uniref:uncharacterized protein LOC109882897 isoform X2 n=1 Tax=Oncorhynchus kisutch TaxID=8019 RepID=UPI0012DCD04D|nr:uncharacterized protein LOC109882897 isoform X2 [Oncorhynchus kisutch]
MLRYWTPRRLYVEQHEVSENAHSHRASTQMRGIERLIFLFWLLQGVLFIDGVEEVDNEIDHSADSDGVLFIDGLEEADNEIDQSADSDGVLFIDGVEVADNEIDQSADSDGVLFIDGLEEADNEIDQSADSDGDLSVLLGVGAAGMGLLAVLALSYRRMQHVKWPWNLNPEDTPEVIVTYWNNCVANEATTEETTAEHGGKVEPITVEP